MLKKIQNYWQDRASSFTQESLDELNSEEAKIWQEIFKAYTSTNLEDANVLDVGCGPGNFGILLAKLGAKVKALDYTPEMLRLARENAENHRVEIEFFQGDAQKLAFETKSFDMIVSRNLTWNLTNPKKAYQEWYRVLRTNGRMLNFDANWYLSLFKKDKDFKNLLDDIKDIPDYSEIYPNAHKIEKIARDLPLSKVLRPDWDENVLLEIGFKLIACKKTFYTEFFGKEKYYTPIFFLVGEKH